MAIDKINLFGQEYPISGSMPPATTETLGSVQIGDGITVDENGVISINPTSGLNVNVVDNLTSTSTTDVLSANQGRVLKELVDNKANSTHNHSASNITSGILSADRGGTGVSGLLAARRKMTYLGSNLTTTTSEDTATFWENQGYGFCYYNNSGTVIDKPTTYGHLYNMSVSAEQPFNQLWMSFGSEPRVWLRSGYNGEWYNGTGAWTPLTPFDSGWNTMTLTSTWTNYGTDGAWYKRVGDQIFLTGAISPASNFSSTLGSTSVTITTLPVGYRPSRTYAFICQGSGANIWTMRVTSAGVVSAERYRSGSTYETPSTTSWFTFSGTYITNEDFPS